MSAPTALHSREVARGILVAGRSRTKPKGKKTRTQILSLPSPRDRRSRKPMASLSRLHDEVCREAVDSGEIAATLEASGVNDRMAREQYAVGSVFQLAEVLFHLVPQRISEWERPRDPWQYPVSRHLRRGVLYALPTLPYLAALRVLHGSISGVLTLLAGSVVAMAATHGLSYVGHLLVGYGSFRSAAHVLQRGLVAAIVFGGAAAGFLLWQGHLERGPIAVAYVELVYVVAATVLMVLERERLLFLALLPAVGASVIALVRPDMPESTHLSIFGLVAACVTLTAGSAFLMVRRFERTNEGGRMRLARQEVRRAGAHALYGSVTAGLLMYAVLDALIYENPVSSNTLIGIGMLPLVMSLGITEWNLHGFRSDTEKILHATHDFHRFATKVRWCVLRRTAVYGSVLVALTAAILLPLGHEGSLSSVLGLRHLGYDLLGLALFLATVLVSCGLIESTLMLLTVTLVVDSSLRLVVPDRIVEVTILHCVVFASLTVMLGVTAYRQLSSPLRFR
jgi:hypothetical protein